MNKTRFRYHANQNQSNVGVDFYQLSRQIFRFPLYTVCKKLKRKRNINSKFLNLKEVTDRCKNVVFFQIQTYNSLAFRAKNVLVANADVE